MNNGNRKGVSIEGHTINTNDSGDIIVRRSFVADELDLNDAAWRSHKLSDFLNQVGETMFEFKGEEGIHHPLKVDEPIIESFDNGDSLYPQVLVKFSAKILGRKELN